VGKKTIECEVSLPEGDARFGKFANAFRVVRDTGGECFLDFCVYSAQENRAMVISRLRIHTSFLPSIRERVSAAMHDLGMVDTFRVQDGMLTNSDGDLILFRTNDEEQ
jgi:hypothetical protein